MFEEFGQNDKLADKANDSKADHIVSKRKDLTATK